MDGAWRRGDSLLPVSAQSSTVDQTSPEPEGALPSSRRMWTTLGIGAALFLAVLFVVTRLGAEEGNEVRFGFPEKVEGIKLVDPDRAPEARGRDITARYNKAGDDLHSLYVEWLPETSIEDAVPWQGSFGEAEGVMCGQRGEAVCLAKVDDGVVRVRQEGLDLDALRTVALSFRDGMKLPD